MVNEYANEIQRSHEASNERFSFEEMKEADREFKESWPATIQNLTAVVTRRD